VATVVLTCRLSGLPSKRLRLTKPNGD